VHLPQRDAQAGHAKMIEAIAAVICATSIAAFLLYVFDLLYRY
jgi:hypothetical protein